MSNVAEQFAQELKSQAFNVEQPKKLESTSQEGNFVLQGQELATKEGFRNVSKIWYNKTMSWEKGLEELDKGRAITEDLMATVQEMKPTVKENGFCFEYKDGRTFAPTSHCMDQIGIKSEVGTWFVKSLTNNPLDKKGKTLYARDKGDAETLSHVLQNGFRRLDQNKKFLWRTRQDGTLRAMLTDRYAVVDNRWFLEKVKELIPGGRLSHWRGDSDTIYGNILIPDTIREEKDSDYGGMLSIGNSEIGERRISSFPSIFRAICMNGCIWGRTTGENIDQVHRGKIDLMELYHKIKDNLLNQIPLLPQGIDLLLNTRTMTWGGVSIRPVIAQASKTLKFDRSQSVAVLDAWEAEKLTLPEHAYSAFGIVNAITRAGQTFKNDRWLSMDESGGRLAEFDKDDWENLISRAKTLKAKEVEEVFAIAA